MKKETKKCRDCKEEKPLDSFIKNKSTCTGIDSLCLLCNRKRVKAWRKKNPELRRLQQLRESSCDKVYNQRKHLKSTYGITVEEYSKMFNDQKGCCAICGAHQDLFSRRLHVDHCHKTGRIRQLLCMDCNHLLGRAKDDISILNEAISYLMKHTQQDINL